MPRDLSASAIDLNCVDARVLHMEAEFFQLTKAQSDTLLDAFVEWCFRLLPGHFISSWFFNNKKIRYENLFEAIHKKDAGALGLEGETISEQVCNKKTLERYKRELCYPSFGSQRGSLPSKDYWEFYHRQLRKREENVLNWKDTVLSFFNEPNRILYREKTHLDLQGIAVRIPYHADSDSFYGQIKVSISVHCLGDKIHAVSSEMARFLSEQAKMLANINGRIAITPIAFPSKCSGHMFYFGNNIQENESSLPKDFFPLEWFPHYYICGAEWYNVISPLAQMHRPGLWEDAKRYSGILTQRHPNGSMTAAVDKQPNCLDIADLAPIKQLLYECLYPGMSRMPKRAFLDPDNTVYIAKPRMRWECVPVFENEILQTEKDIIFRHTNCVIPKQ